MKQGWLKNRQTHDQFPEAHTPQLSVPRQTVGGPTLAGGITMRYCQRQYLGEKFDQPYLCSHGALGVEEKHSNVLNAAQ